MLKIDPSIQNIVNIYQNKKDNAIDCIVFSNNYNKTRRLLEAINKDGEVHCYPFISAFGVKTQINNIIKMANYNHISYIQSQTKVFAQIDRSKEIIGVKKLYDEGNYGEDCVIAVIDTGISPHLDFMVGSKKIIKFVDLIQNKKQLYDDNGHGTFITGIIAGSGICSNKKYQGIAPNSKIISIKALDAKGETGTFTILQAMQWIFDNCEKYNIKVVCMSFGSNPLGKKDPLLVGAESLWNKGICVVAAAGNSGPNPSTIKSPGISSKIITVGALDDGRNGKDEGKIDSKKFTIAEFSSRGPAYSVYKPDLIAPGVNIRSVSNKNDQWYCDMSGTSLSAPIVAGVCALIVNKNKNITPNEIKAMLLRNANKISISRNDDGFGVIDCSKI